VSAIGAIIMGLFAALWWIVGTGASGRGSGPMYTVAIVITGLIVGAASRQAGRTSGSPEERARRGRLVGIASGVEGLVIFVSINVLANIGRRDLAAPIIAIIVGLHFLPLARWLRVPLYYVTSALLVGLGIACVRVRDANFRLFTVSVGAACVLWLTCGAVFWYGDRQEAAR
jgi:hypothetical protein